MQLKLIICKYEVGQSLRELRSAAIRFISRGNSTWRLNKMDPRVFIPLTSGCQKDTTFAILHKTQSTYW